MERFSQVTGRVLMPDGARSMAFLDPLERISFQLAVKSRATEFRTKIPGLVITLDYDRKPGFIWFQPKEPVKGISNVPCGWLSIQAVLENIWVRS